MLVYSQCVVDESLSSSMPPSGSAELRVHLWVFRPILRFPFPGTTFSPVCHTHANANLILWGGAPRPDAQKQIETRKLNTMKERSETKTISKTPANRRLGPNVLAAFSANKAAFGALALLLGGGSPTRALEKFAVPLAAI